MLNTSSFTWSKDSCHGQKLDPQNVPKPFQIFESLCISSEHGIFRPQQLEDWYDQYTSAVFDEMTLVNTNPSLQNMKEIKVCLWFFPKKNCNKKINVTDMVFCLLKSNFRSCLPLGKIWNLGSNSLHYVHIRLALVFNEFFYFFPKAYQLIGSITAPTLWNNLPPSHSFNHLL